MLLVEFIRFGALHASALQLYSATVVHANRDKQPRVIYFLSPVRNTRHTFSSTERVADYNETSKPYLRGELCETKGREKNGNTVYYHHLSPHHHLPLIVGTIAVLLLSLLSLLPLYRQITKKKKKKQPHFTIPL